MHDLDKQTRPPVLQPLAHPQITGPLEVGSAQQMSPVRPPGAEEDTGNHQSEQRSLPISTGLQHWGGVSEEAYKGLPVPSHESSRHLTPFLPLSSSLSSCSKLEGKVPGLSQTGERAGSQAGKQKSP